MSFEVKLPDFGPLVEDAKVVRWIKKEGDAVAKGDALVEVDIDKANMEIESPESGMLAKIVAQVGDVVEPGAALAIIEVGE